MAKATELVRITIRIKKIYLLANRMSNSVDKDVEILLS